jgi:hypothetical protein
VISFRYHLVSIIAVFLALALGIVVGTTGLNGAILSDLRSNVKSQKNDIAKLRTENSDLQKQAGNADDFASAYSKQLLAGTLTDQTVVIVSAPGASGKIKSGVESAVTSAGGTIVGKIQLSADYVDPQRGSDITALATSAAHPSGLTLPSTSDSATLGGALLGYVLSGQGSGSDIGKVLAGFSVLNMLKVEGSDPKGAKLAIVIGSGSAQASDPKTKSLPVLVSEFNQNGLKTVVVGDEPSSTAAGLVALIRSDSILPRAVSTVDNGDTALGQVSTVLALNGLLEGTVGQYGTAPGVTALFPSPPK